MKNRNEKLLAVLVGCLALTAVALIVVVSLFHVVDFKLYSKKLDFLDLRGQKISVSHYEKLVRAMPDCEILWDIPFKGGVLTDGTTEVSLTALSEEEVRALTHLKTLKTVHAEGCRDYALLLQLQEQLPQVKVLFTVPLGGREFPQDAKVLEVTGVSSEEIDNLPYLRKLEQIIVRGTEQQPDYSMLRRYCQDMNVVFSVCLGETVVPYTTREVTAVEIRDQDVFLLRYLPHMTSLHLVQPQTEPDTIFHLQEDYPDVRVTWEVELFGDIIDSTDVPKELDLSKVEITSLEELEYALSYLDGLETVFLGDPEFDDEEVAAYRERVRGKYKVVWEVFFGNTKPFRTDSTYFFPARDGYVFRDKYSAAIRYCEDLICVDVGHLGVSDVSWLAYLPNLEYLILAHTGVMYIDGIENCKKLKFLELDWTGIRDLTPLLGCTALEDLNIGNTWPDITPLMKMPWLKNVYMIFGSGADAAALRQALPNTHVVSSGNATVGGNWRKLPNYYAMRDCMGAYYMHG